MGSTNYISSVAIVGATGHSGSFMVDFLLKTGKHTITALTRGNSSNKLPDGVITKKIDYDSPETLVEALKGQDALVIILSSHAPDGTELKLVNAAGEAGVKWILPNDWSPDSTNEGLLKDVFVFPPKSAIRKAITDIGKSHYIGVSTGFWYEWSLAIEPAFGIDLLNHKATFFDDGEIKISTSTWPQVGRAVASLLSLPIKSEDQACLENFKDQVIYIKSFTVSQKDMWASALRMTDTNEEDWTITTEPSQERFMGGVQDAKEGNRFGFAKMLYTRVFYPDGCGNIERKGPLNKLLGLPEEDIDEATKVAIHRAKVSPWS
ncbi:hypothetical protein N7495_009378 [Penicillium taxi]|uniref:uncharacterized protein n=1 Tax=Penicillium taxi TaxID=168475 RepID=UPI0025451A71|nr:uncharacterized protein N7495_009378 [Penicillium taxi]KAJ5884868.1 hypothetical protein N7495_009378 [Penicillium taxi]